MVHEYFPMENGSGNDSSFISSFYSHFSFILRITNKVENYAYLTALGTIYTHINPLILKMILRHVLLPPFTYWETETESINMGYAAEATEPGLEPVQSSLHHYSIYHCYLVIH